LLSYATTYATKTIAGQGETEGKAGANGAIILYGNMYV
jgi:hypothetical protein